MNTNEILCKAAGIIKERGWYQGDYYDISQPEETAPVCLFGAINIVLHGHPDPDEHYEEYTTEANKLSSELSKRAGSLFSSLWNDAEGRTQEEVIAILTQEC